MGGEGYLYKSLPSGRLDFFKNYFALFLGIN